MDFQETKSIYLQIADTICDRILNNTFEAGKRLPSVREMAAEVGVNPNTVMRSYSDLEGNGIIKNKRGVGFFVLDTAYSTILQLRKATFFANLLPQFLEQTALLKLSTDEIFSIIEPLKELITDEKK